MYNLYCHEQIGNFTDYKGIPSQAFIVRIFYVKKTRIFIDFFKMSPRDIFNPFTAKYPSLELIITKILAKKEKLV